jgi:hypothetical protein
MTEVRKKDVASLPASQLDDDADREELRQRYYGLLQELRVLLPGVQVLAAFLLTAPFAQRFGDLDRTSEIVYGVSLVSAVASVIAFVTPTTLHRMGLRTSRVERLRYGIKATRVGIACMAVALECALFVVCRLIFSTAMAVVTVTAVGLVMVGLWIILPISVGRGKPFED